jgi:hypothetical protein
MPTNPVGQRLRVGAVGCATGEVAGDLTAVVSDRPTAAQHDPLAFDSADLRQRRPRHPRRAGTADTRIQGGVCHRLHHPHVTPAMLALGLPHCDGAHPATARAKSAHTPAGAVGAPQPSGLVGCHRGKSRRQIGAQRRLLLIDGQEIGAAVLHDLGAQRPVREQRIAHHHPPSDRRVGEHLPSSAQLMPLALGAQLGDGRLGPVRVDAH